MKRQLFITDDGSHSLRIENTDETYHSVFGAINESKHIFINSGFQTAVLGKSRLDILEVGFGTGLNALLTLLESRNSVAQIHYLAIEPYPLARDEYQRLNYCEQIGCMESEAFSSMHDAADNDQVEIRDNFVFRKMLLSFEYCILPPETFDLVYFDAFAPDFQPELWTDNVFEKLFLAMKTGSLLLTYSSKGSVRRAMERAGFRVERIPGPVGKREISRAIKDAKNYK